MGKPLPYVTIVRRLLAASFLATFLGLCVQCVAIFSPAWYYTEERTLRDIHSRDFSPKWTFHEGIWLAKFCRAGEECILAMRENIFAEIGISESLSPLDETHWLEFKVLSCFSIAGALLCIVTCIIASVKTINKHHICQHLSLLLTALIGAVLSFSTLLIPALKLWSLSEQVYLSASWSMLVSVVGSVLQFLASTSLLMAIFHDITQLQRMKQRRQRRSERLRQNQHLSRYLQDCQNEYRSDDTEETVGTELRTSNDSGVQSINSSIGHKSCSPGGHITSAPSISSRVSHGTARPSNYSNQPPPYSEIAALPAYGEIAGV